MSMDNTNIELTMGLVQFVIGLILFIGTICVGWGMLKAKVDRLEKDVDKLSDSLDTKFSDLNASMIALFKKDTLGVEGSPYHPSQLGKELLEKSGWNVLYPQIKDQIFALIKESNVKNLYDIEKESFRSLSKLKNTNHLDKIKEYIVNNPEHTLDAVLLVASWIIRDDYNEKINK